MCEDQLTPSTHARFALRRRRLKLVDDLMKSSRAKAELERLAEAMDIALRTESLGNPLRSQMVAIQQLILHRMSDFILLEQESQEKLREGNFR